MGGQNAPCAIVFGGWGWFISVKSTYLTDIWDYKAFSTGWKVLQMSCQ